MGTVMEVAIFVGFTFVIWFSYRLFMRGDTAKEKVAALLPPGFKPDLFYRKGDTYVGYEKANNRLVLVDWPHAKVLAPEDVRSLEPVHESMCDGLVGVAGLVPWCAPLLCATRVRRSARLCARAAWSAG